MIFTPSFIIIILHKKYMSELKIIAPQPGYQENFVRSNVDFLIGGGVVGSGKTFATFLSTAYYIPDPNFRAVFFRKTRGELKAGGGMIDEAKKIFDGIASFNESDNPSVKFHTGAVIEYRQMYNETEDSVMESVKGSQYSYIYFDEATSFKFKSITTLMTRNRTTANMKAKIRMTTNPKSDCWVRDIIDWYIGEDGYVIPERNGVVRYFFMNGETVEDIVWGNTKEEVYMQVKDLLDGYISALGEADFSYENFILSFCYLQGSLSENKSMDKSYVAKIAAAGESNFKRLALGNWDIDTDDDKAAVVNESQVSKVFTSYPNSFNDWWITVDLAYGGTDNTVLLVWHGFHVVDIGILQIATQADNVNLIRMYARKYNIRDSRIIYDMVPIDTLRSDIPHARGYNGSHVDKLYNGICKEMYPDLKSECAFRFMEMVKNGSITFDRSIGNKEYIHQSLKKNAKQRTIKQEFEFECSAVRFITKPNGKKKIMNKKKMNIGIGGHMSMDLLDPCFMRMSVILKYPIGEEIEYSLKRKDSGLQNRNKNNENSIFSNTW